MQPRRSRLARAARLTTSIVWSVVVLSLVAFIAGVGVAGFTDTTQSIHLDRPCVAEDTSDCVVRTPARVVSADDADGTVKVQDDDGTHTIDFSAAHALPATGARVTLERWNGNVVSVFDVRSERRYHTLDWPSRWLGVILVAICFAIAAAVLYAHLRSVATRVRAWRSADAAPSESTATDAGLARTSRPRWAGRPRSRPQ